MIDLIDEIKACVDRGFNRLTRSQRDQIDVDTLRVEDGELCPLGQIYGSFGRGCELRFGSFLSHTALLEAERHGFYVLDGRTDYFTRWTLLTHEWRRRLELERDITELLEPVGSF